MGQNDGVEVTATLETSSDPTRVFNVISDLDNYPAWLSILPKVERVDDSTWQVELQGKIGPLARSKRLRMIRTEQTRPHHVRFEREELDGRRHSAWTLEAEIGPTPSSSCTLTMRLHYGGSFGDQLIERMLRSEIEASRPRLLEILELDTP